MDIARLLSAGKKINIREAVNKFLRNFKNKVQKQAQINNILYPAVIKKEQESKELVLRQMILQHQQARLMKNALVVRLVHSLSTKQKLALNILKLKANELKQLHKRSILTRVF